LVTIASPSSRNDWADNALTASTASGNRAVKSSVAGDQPDTGTVTAGHDAEAIVLDFVNPAVPGRWPFGWGRQARIDVAGSAAGTKTH
jgi:hypothetical protein